MLGVQAEDVTSYTFFFCPKTGNILKALSYPLPLKLRILDAVPSLSRLVDLCGADPTPTYIETCSRVTLMGAIIWGTCTMVGADPGADGGKPEEWWVAASRQVLQCMYAKAAQVTIFADHARSHFELCCSGPA